MTQRYGFQGDPFGYFNMPQDNPVNMGPGLNLNDYVGILKNLQPTKVADDDYENIEEFVQTIDNRNPFQKALDFYQKSPGTRLGLGALLGGPMGALASFFGPQIFRGASEGIGNIFGPRVDMAAVQRGIQAAEDDDSRGGISSFDAAVAAGIQAAEDDSDPGDIGGSTAGMGFGGERSDPTDKS
mgnify:CR=1 FL=1|tara:strand:+ start:102 stop:653 length:552 start_codon:yes stop_codon:yes gene_type:complete